MRETIYYDGHCGLCHRVVRFVLAEDRDAHFRFSPIEGDGFQVVDSAGRTHARSDAYVHIFRRLGGIWGVLGVAVAFVPRQVRDYAYDCVARNRRRVFARPPTACPIVPITLRDRFVVPRAPS